MITYKFSKIGFGAPINENVLLYWENSQHIEDGIITLQDNNELSHCLYDGERLTEEPSHWCHIPPVEVEL